MARKPSARASTRSETPPVTKDDLSTRESLILAQAVFELGVHEWHKVVQILNGHSLIQRPETAFTPESTEAIWRAMMTDAGVELYVRLSWPISSLTTIYSGDADVAKKKSTRMRLLQHYSSNLPLLDLPSRRLAHVWHQRRMAELKDEIAAEEARFKSVAIRVGHSRLAVRILTSSLRTERLPPKSLQSRAAHGTTKSKLCSSQRLNLPRRW